MPAVKLNNAATNLSRAVGRTISEERLARGLSIEELARRAAISAGLLSQLERGIGNPSLTTLTGLARAVDLPIGAFFEGPRSDTKPVVRKLTRKRLLLSDPDITYELLVPDLQGSVALIWVELPPQFSNERFPFTHVGEEAEIVLQGQLEVHVGAERFRLREGDSIRFSSGTRHWYRTFKEPVVVIAAQAPPSF